MKADQSYTEQIKEKLTKEIAIQILLKKSSWSFYPHSATEQANEIAQNVRQVIDDILRYKEIVPEKPPVLEWTAGYKPYPAIEQITKKPKNKMLEQPQSRFKGFID